MGKQDGRGDLVRRRTAGGGIDGQEDTVRGANDDGSRRDAESPLVRLTPHPPRRTDGGTTGGVRPLPASTGDRSSAPGPGRHTGGIPVSELVRRNTDPFPVPGTGTGTATPTPARDAPTPGRGARRRSRSGGRVRTSAFGATTAVVLLAGTTVGVVSMASAGAGPGAPTDPAAPVEQTLRIAPDHSPLAAPVPALDVGRPPTAGAPAGASSAPGSTPTSAPSPARAPRRTGTTTPPDDPTAALRVARTRDAIAGRTATGRAAPSDAPTTADRPRGTGTTTGPARPATTTPPATPSDTASEEPSEEPSERPSETPSETPSDGASDGPSEAPSSSGPAPTTASTDRGADPDDG